MESTSQNISYQFQASSFVSDSTLSASNWYVLRGTDLMLLLGHGMLKLGGKMWMPKKKKKCMNILFTANKLPVFKVPI